MFPLTTLTLKIKIKRYLLTATNFLGGVGLGLGLNENEREVPLGGLAQQFSGILLKSFANLGSQKNKKDMD